MNDVRVLIADDEPLAGESRPVTQHDRYQERAHAEPHETDVRQRVEAARDELLAALEG